MNSQELIEQAVEVDLTKHAEVLAQWIDTLNKIASKTSGVTPERKPQ